eukprot:m.21602 g.21602  ORF g.21602 m.21602 type:complete len:141 (+) comp28190_c0_seq1:60-482(+)
MGEPECIAVDCEMVGVGTHWNETSMLARVSLVDSSGDVLYDTFVAPQQRVINYRTPVSGVRPEDLRGAPDFQSVQSEVKRLIKGKRLIGHSMNFDLDALKLSHPPELQRDTAEYPPFITYNRVQGFLNALHACLHACLHA